MKSDRVEFIPAPTEAFISARTARSETPEALLECTPVPSKATRSISVATAAVVLFGKADPMLRFSSSNSRLHLTKTIKLLGMDHDCEGGITVSHGSGFVLKRWCGVTGDLSN